MKKVKAKEKAKASAKAKVTCAPFEVADYFDSEEAIAEYLSLAVRDENPGVLLKALGDVAKAALRSVPDCTPHVRKSPLHSRSSRRIASTSGTAVRPPSVSMTRSNCLSRDRA